MRQTLLSEDTAGYTNTAPVFRKTGPQHGLPLRSHNSLLYDCPSTKCPGLPITRMQAKACSGASCRVPVAPGAIAFRGLPKWIWRKPLSARTAGAAAHQSAERIGGGDRNRTDDPLLAKQVLSQLSYTPGVCAANTATSGVSRKRREWVVQLHRRPSRSLLRKPLSG